MPNWALAPDKEVGSGARAVKRRIEDVVAGGGDKQGTINKLVVILSKLSLMQGEILRELCSVVFHTFLVPVKSTIVVEMRAMGKSYPALAEEIGKIEDPEQKAKAVEEQGPPFLHIFLAMIKGMAAGQGECAMKEEGQAKLKTYWDTVITKFPSQKLTEQIKYCKCKDTKKKEGKPEWARVIFAVELSAMELEKVFIDVLVRHGGQKQYGPAPRGPLEREAQRLLDSLAKK